MAFRRRRAVKSFGMRLSGEVALPPGFVSGRIEAARDAFGEAEAFRIGIAAASVFTGGPVVVGRDGEDGDDDGGADRGEALSDALARGLAARGTDAVDLGDCGREEVDFAISYLGAAGGLALRMRGTDEVVLEFVGAGCRPLTEDAFRRVGVLARAQNVDAPLSSDAAQGTVRRMDLREAFAWYVTGLVVPGAIGSARLCVGAGSRSTAGTLAAVAEALRARGADLEVIGDRAIAANRMPGAIRRHGCHMGLQLDDGCLGARFLDDVGRVVRTPALAAILADAAIRHAPGGLVLHDPAYAWTLGDRVARAGGESRNHSGGAATLAQAMRDAGAVYGTHRDGRHVFRDFMFRDSGMISLLRLLEVRGRARADLSHLVEEQEARFPASDVLSFDIREPGRAMDDLHAMFRPAAIRVQRDTALTMTFEAWRFHLWRRGTSGLGLTVETRRDPGLLADRIAALSQRIEGYAAAG